MVGELRFRTEFKTIPLTFRSYCGNKEIAQKQKGDIVEKIASKVSQTEGSKPETSVQILKLLLGFIRSRSFECDVENIVRHAEIHLCRISFPSAKKVEIEEELKALRMDGYEAEAFNNFEMAIRLCKETDVTEYIKKMHIFLSKAGLEEEFWLRGYEFSLSQIDSVLENGIKNRKRNLQEARDRRAEMNKS
ncbi:MAG: hypothetical protein PHX30_04230 [Candidatus Pacebacteria bacterium]|jgi:hypothetical protein|nr:hypothetical protein [Candidatus Paceibacterota bacterium]